jgi:type VI secretion system protein
VSASLLTRIAHLADPTNVERHTWRDHDLDAAVATHLVNMLNTKQGSSLTCPDYGVPELTELLHDLPDAISIMQRSIKQCITQYEPRLRNVQVRHVPQEAGTSLVLSFEVTAQLVYPDGRKAGFRFGALFDHRGNASTPGV